MGHAVTCMAPCRHAPPSADARLLREKNRPDKDEAHAAFMRRSASQDFSAVSSSESMSEELVYEKLPKDIAERHVLLMDPILATGHSAERAINVSMVELLLHWCLP